MDNGLLQALMMGMGAGAGNGAGDGGLLGQGGVSPQLLQFASGALTGGGFQGGAGKLMGSLLARKMRQRALQQQPGVTNPLDGLLSGDPGSGMQPMA